MMEEFVEQKNIYEISLPEKTDDRLLLQIREVVNLLKEASVGFLFVANHCNVIRLEKYLKKYISLKANKETSETEDSEQESKTSPTKEENSSEKTMDPDVLSQQKSSDDVKATPTDETDEITEEAKKALKITSDQKQSESSETELQDKTSCEDETSPDEKAKSTDDTDEISVEEAKKALEGVSDDTEEESEKEETKTSDESEDAETTTESKKVSDVEPSDETDEIIHPSLQDNAFEAKTEDELATHLEMFCADLLAIKDKFHKITQLKIILRKNFDDLFQLVEFCDPEEQEGIVEALYGCIDNETDERMLAVWVQNLTKFYLPSLKRNYRYYLASGKRVKVPLDSVLNILGTTI